MLTLFRTKTKHLAIPLILALLVMVPSRTAQITSTSAKEPASIEGWVPFTVTPEAVAGYASAQCVNDINHYYLIGGISTEGKLLDTTWRYDAVADTWEELAPLPASLYLASAVCYKNKIYVAGGYDKISISKRFFVYNIADNMWRFAADAPRPAAGAAISAWNDWIFLIGGTLAFLPLRLTGQVDVYNVRVGSWEKTDIPPMPVAAAFMGYAQQGNYVYIAGGVPSRTMRYSPTLRFNLSTFKWERGQNFPSQRAYFAMVATTTHLYAIGGSDINQTKPSNLVEYLDTTRWPKSGWVTFPDQLPEPALLNGTGFCTQVGSGEIWSVGGQSTGKTGKIYLDLNLCHIAGPCQLLSPSE